MKQWLAKKVVWVVAAMAIGGISLSRFMRPVPVQPLILNDFESQGDLERIIWHCRTTFSRTQQFESHGQSGLWMTMYPDAYPGLLPFLTPRETRWVDYRYLALDVFNPGQQDVTLYYRIDDSEDPDYQDRVNGAFRLVPGNNFLRLDLQNTMTSGHTRHLDLRRITKLFFYTISPSRPVSLGVDYLRLEPDGGVR